MYMKGRNKIRLIYFSDRERETDGRKRNRRNRGKDKEEGMESKEMKGKLQE